MGKNNLILCDTNIYIKLLREDEKVKQNLHLISYQNVAFSIITHAEIYQGAKKSEFSDEKRLLNSFNVLHLDSEISKIFNGLILNYSISHGIKIPDALIAATAISNNLQLYTENVKDFKFIPEIRLYKPI